MMASMDKAEHNSFQKYSAHDSQFCKQDCTATVAGSERSTAPNSSAGDFPDEDSMFEEPLPVSSAPMGSLPTSPQSVS
ncbi:hypothetical protein DSO57_1031879 [Entomophthora muscae]|uniref:Uncharacterized protein n=1 Tax=Entomophthora muscae TaxID=34485 RepID=A0ACC2RRL3_9FUNG|nr:hypothetical protein DSO57_1031879 [Entomophthora muscae]